MNSRKASELARVRQLPLRQPFELAQGRHHESPHPWALQAWRRSGFARTTRRERGLEDRSSLPSICIYEADNGGGRQSQSAPWTRLVADRVYRSLGHGPWVQRAAREYDAGWNRATTHGGQGLADGSSAFGTLAARGR